jgi:hypothetical protein
MEKIFNLFLFVEKNKITEIGAVIYAPEIQDQQKIDFLRERVHQYCNTCDRFKLKKPLSWWDYQAMVRLGTNFKVFEDVFQHFEANIDPLCVITPIVDNIPTFDTITDTSCLHFSELVINLIPKKGIMIDYLQGYVNDGFFDIPRLINDDYFLAIKLCLQNKLYISSAKLLMSFLDTIAFLDSSNEDGNFKLWLKTYADVECLGVTEDELWEYRNGLLHMSNLNSKKIRSGKIKPIILYIGPLIMLNNQKDEEHKYLHYKSLLDVIVKALEKWIQTYVNNPEKLTAFVKNYDLTVSDVRISVLHPHQPA